MKALIIFFFFTPFISAAQYNNDRFIMPYDTSEVVSYLNGTWKLKIKSTVHLITFNFDEHTLSCIDSIHPNWYDETDTRYELKWNSNLQLYLESYTIDDETNDFKELPFKYQLLPMTKKRMIIDINDDFGVFEMKKVKN